MTLTSIGYGDITPSSTFERFCCVFCMSAPDFSTQESYGVSTWAICNNCTRRAGKLHKYFDMLIFSKSIFSGLL